MAVYNDRMAELCDALDARVDQAAAGDVIQAFWISFIELVDALEHHRNGRALPWDNVRTACWQLLPRVDALGVSELYGFGQTCSSSADG